VLSYSQEKGRQAEMTAGARGQVFGGVDTHGRAHHAAAVDGTGQVLGDQEFPASFDPAEDGRLFAGVRGGDLPTITYRRAWAKARQGSNRRYRH
jgi:hypothetical protein